MRQTVRKEWRAGERGKENEVERMERERNGTEGMVAERGGKNERTRGEK